MSAQFRFPIRDYSDPVLDEEVPELFRQRLEAASRKVMPKVWKVTDSLNSRAEDQQFLEKRRKRYRIYGVILLVLGILVTIPTLLTASWHILPIGAVAIFCGLLELWIANSQDRLKIPASCRKEAEHFLESRRAADLTTTPVRLDVGPEGVELWSGKKREQTTPWKDVLTLYESGHAWLLTFQTPNPSGSAGKKAGESGLLLLKKDLQGGTPEEFVSFVEAQV